MAIVVLLAVVSAGLMLGLATERQPVPEVELAVVPGDNAAEHRLLHESGELLNGGAVELQGATDPDVLEGSELTAGDREQFYAVDETIEVVWYEDGDEASYILREFELDGDETVPDPDEGCPWVESESNDGTDSVTVDGLVIDCNIETDEQVTVKNGGVVIGDTTSNLKDVDADDADFYGDADVENVFNLQDGLVTGSVDSDTADVKLDNATVGGSATAEKVVELQGDSTVEGDATSRTKSVKLLGGSTVEGDAVSETDQVKVTDSTVSGAIYGGGSVDLDGATVEGDVYVDATDFTCTDSTIDGQDCGSYTPEDPGDY